MECLCLLIFFGALGGAVAGFTSGPLGHFYHGILMLGQGKTFGFIPKDDEYEEEEDLFEDPPIIGTQTPTDVKALLVSHLDPTEYRCFEDIAVSAAEDARTFQHVVVSPYGVSCVRRLDYDGILSGGVEDFDWMHETTDNVESFPNPLTEAKEDARALAKRLGLSTRVLVPLVVSAGRANFEEAVPPGVHMGSKVIDAINRRNTVRLSQETINETCRLLGLPP
jgi:hypothetical protein